LADKAGLECIVVTGYLYGNLPHAWNRVKIDRHWMTVDSTNNGMEFLRNPILNLPDNVASTFLVEDNFYISGDKSAYIGEKASLEYYHYMEDYYSQSQIVDALIEGLQGDGSVMLRTDYDLSEKQYNEIVRAVAIKSGYYNALAFMWLGVIYMSLPT